MNDRNEPSGSIAPEKGILDVLVGATAATIDVVATSGLGIDDGGATFVCVPAASGLVAGFIVRRGDASLATIANLLSAISALSLCFGPSNEGAEIARARGAWYVGVAALLRACGLREPPAPPAPRS